MHREILHGLLQHAPSRLKGSSETLWNVKCRQHDEWMLDSQTSKPPSNNKRHQQIVSLATVKDYAVCTTICWNRLRQPVATIHDGRNKSNGKSNNDDTYQTNAGSTSTQ
jgi:hypothetical protein